MEYSKTLQSILLRENLTLKQNKIWQSDFKQFIRVLNVKLTNIAKAYSTSGRAVMEALSKRTS